MSEFSVSLAKLAEEANLTIAYTPCELDKIQVTATEVYRPGILLAGYYENFDSKRIQIIGLTEMSYLDELSTSLRNTHLEKLFSFQPPAIVLTRGMQPLSEMMQFAKQYGVPILMSTEMTSALMGQLITTLNTELAPRITRHGVLMNINGQGVLLLGESGIGKSETAIELLKRGHRLGRIIREGAAIPNTGIPGVIGGYGAERVIHAQAAGIFKNVRVIGDIVEAGDTIAEIWQEDGTKLLVQTQITGILRGLLRDGYRVTEHFKVADVDPRKEELSNCFLISDKARCIAGSVLELVCALLWK